ncbi:MAG: hypothetical protein QGH45_25450, partial [Myxococcota bacterium]|nr:hypothetical protein [Myxococcota bacterium]
GAPSADDGGGLDSSREQWALGENDALLAATTDDGHSGLAGGGEEDLDDEERQAYLTDFLNKFEGMEDEEESGEESGPGSDEALFVPFASDGPSGDPAPSPPADEEPAAEPPAPAMDPAPVAPPTPLPATPAPFSSVAAEPSEDSTAGEPSIPDWPSAAQPAPWDPAPSVPDPDPEPEPEPGSAPLEPPVPLGPDRLLGALDDDVAARVAEALAPPAPQVQPEPVRRAEAVEPSRGLAEETSLSPPDLEQLLADYYIVVRPVSDGSDVWIGRLFRDKLFDLHRYQMPSVAGGGMDLDRVIESFLRDKIDENFLTFGSRFDAIPADGSEPVSLPIDVAERILMGLL